MARSASSFKRKPASYKPQPRILILCEDKKSCRTYLGEAAQYFRCHADVEIVHTGNTDPLSIVEEAKRRHAAYDSTYCVVDRDTHETFDEALTKAAQAPVITVIDSHPCYEYWLLLHFRRTRSPYAQQGDKSPADCVVAALRKSHAAMNDYSKSNSAGLFTKLLENLQTARTNAQWAIQQAELDGELNPSTRIHELMTRFESLAKPQLITDAQPS